MQTEQPLASTADNGELLTFPIEAAEAWGFQRDLFGGPYSTDTSDSKPPGGDDDA